MKIVIASANQAKVAELTASLSPVNHSALEEIEWLNMVDFSIESPKETGSSFIENALIKARHSAKHSRLPSLADDSGLCVKSLGWRPGIHSSSYSGVHATDKDHINLLLESLQHIKDRQAFFYCVLVYVRNDRDPIPIIAEGYWFGEILREPEGEGGFGYDPIFYDPKLQQSAATLGEKKLAYSHRGKAIKKIKRLLVTRSLS